MTTGILGVDGGQTALYPGREVKGKIGQSYASVNILGMADMEIGIGVSDRLE